MDLALNTEASDGWIYARIKLDWTTLVDAGGETQLTQSSETVEGELETPAVEIRDEATGIKVEAEPGVLPEGAALTVEAITAESTSETAKAAYAKAQTALEGVAVKFKLFDITILSEDGEETQPKDGYTLTLRFPVPEGFDGAKLALYRINDDATATLIKGKVENDEFVVLLNHLSLYAIVETVEANEAEETAAPEEAPVDEETVPEEREAVSLVGGADIIDAAEQLSDFTPPQTGDESVMVYAVFSVLAIAGLAALVLGGKKRKRT
jgi:LPXTG-motif cell wall-anchored protein